MQFSIQQAALAVALAQLGGIAVRSGIAQPILANIHMKLDGNSLSLAATDLEVYARTTVEVDGKADGETTVNAAKLQALVKAMPAADVTFKLGDKDSATLTSGRSRFKLMTLPAEDYPAPKAEDGGSRSTVTLPGSALAVLFDRVQRAMAVGDVRPYLNGVLVELSESALRLVATDGHRLSLAEHHLEHSQEPMSTILPRKGVLEFLRAVKSCPDDVQLSLSRVNVTLTAGPVLVTSQAIDGRYPDYDAVIPAPNGSAVVIDRAALLSALDRVGVTANDKQPGMRIDLKPGVMELSTDSAGLGSGEDSLEVEFDGKPITVGFNLTYIRDALNAIGSDTVELHVKDGLASSLFLSTDEHDRGKHVVMPLKL